MKLDCKENCFMNQMLIVLSFFFFIASVAFCLQRKADDVPTSSVK